MKVVSYQAADGTLFSTQAEQAKYDTALKVCDAVAANPEFSELSPEFVSTIARNAAVLLEILKANVVPVYGPRGKKSAVAAK